MCKCARVCVYVFVCISVRVSLTVSFEVHAPKHERADELGLHVAVAIDEDGGQVAVGVVGDAGGGDGLQELGLRKLPGQGGQVLVDQRAQRDSGRRERKTEILSRVT